MYGRTPRISILPSVPFRPFCSNDPANRDIHEWPWDPCKLLRNVTVEIDGTEIDPSRYDTVYANNINTGEASVTVTGGKAARGKADGAFPRVLVIAVRFVISCMVAPLV